MNNIWKNKYRKYKNKYLKLKNLLGGSRKIILEGSNNVEKYTTNDINKFHNIIESYPDNDLVMVVGADLLNDSQKDYGIDIDVGWSLIGSRLEEINELDENSIKWFQVDYDFNFNINYRNMIIESSTRNLKKFKKIIFDWSTTKFLSNIKFIAYAYYILLANGGEIYLDPSFSMTYLENCQYIQISKLDGTKYYSHYRKIHNCPESIERTPSIETIFENILENNRQYLLYNLFDSNVTIERNYELYPIKGTSEPINIYYKIEKNLDGNFEIKRNSQVTRNLFLDVFYLFNIII